MRKLSIEFGAIVDDIGKQLADQGLTLTVTDTALHQKHADAITRLKIHGLISDSAAEAARKKLLKQIAKAVYVETEE